MSVFRPLKHNGSSPDESRTRMIPANDAVVVGVPRANDARRAMLLMPLPPLSFSRTTWMPRVIRQRKSLYERLKHAHCCHFSTTTWSHHFWHRLLRVEYQRRHLPTSRYVSKC